jgi:hypothetical protein
VKTESDTPPEQHRDSHNGDGALGSHPFFKNLLMRAALHHSATRDRLLPVPISAGQCRLVVQSIQPAEGGQKEPNRPKTVPQASPLEKVPYLFGKGSLSFLEKVPYLFRRGKAPLAAGKPGQNGTAGLVL